MASGLRSSHGCIRLYPEDVEKIFEMVEPGHARSRVVNQPFVFGWHEDQLYLQAYDVLEDDKRDWAKAQPKLLSKTLTQAHPGSSSRRATRRSTGSAWRRSRTIRAASRCR